VIPAALGEMARITERWQFKVLVVALTVLFGFVTVLRILFWMVTHPISWFRKKERRCE
jgi:uncharacterized protein HemY